MLVQNHFDLLLHRPTPRSSGVTAPPLPKTRLSMVGVAADDFPGFRLGVDTGIGYIAGLSGDGSPGGSS
jgi:hypothetical protein